MTKSGSRSDLAVLVFGGRRAPRALAGLRAVPVESDGQIAEEITGAGRVAVVGTEADLAAVLTGLLRTERLDVEVAHVCGWRSARRAVTGSARRVPLIRDDTATALAGSALWLPPEGAAVLRGEAIVDDTELFDGDVAGVRIEPTSAMPGLRAAVLVRPAGLTGPTARPRRWAGGRAAQLGTTGARVVRDGVPGRRDVRRSTFYRHTQGWLRVG